MPAVRPGGAPPRRGLVEHLQEQAPRKEVNHGIALRHYLHSADLLVAQAAQYRACGNEEQLYVMLMRLASLVIETIPSHRDFAKDSAEYRRWQRYVSDSALPEASRLKAALRTRDHEEHAAAAASASPSAPPMPGGGSGSATTSPSAPPATDWRAPVARSTYGTRAGRRPEGAVPLAASTLPEADWTAAGTPAPEAPGAGPEASREEALGFPWPADFGGGGSAGGALAAASQRSLDRHALFSRPAPRPGGGASGAGGGAAAAQQAAALAALRPGGDDAAAAAALRGRYPSVGAPGGGAAMAAAMAAAAAAGAPSAGLLPPPVQVPVGLMDPSLAAPGGTCSNDAGAAAHYQQHALPAPPPPPSAALVPAQPQQPRRPTTTADLRDVHVSIALMNDFLALAAANTRRGIETCAILAGRLVADDSLFAVTTLIVPKQEGTSDTVSALCEEEIYEAQSARDLYPLGWIHTHPTQTCFLSSVDVHTQCGYQTMLDEAVAVVMAPTDSRSRCGIFRLSTPGGLGLVQRCPQRGFHSHPPTATAQPVYELCGHVYVNASVRHEVIDLR